MTDVREPMLQGHRPVAGLWLPARRFTEGERAGLVLAHWRRGATVLRFAEGDLLRWPAPSTLDCRALRAWPVVRDGMFWSTAALSAHERAALPACDLVVVRGGDAVPLHFAQAVSLDAAAWLDVGAFALHDTFDDEVVAPVLELVDPPLPEGDIRDVLGLDMPPASDAQHRMRRQLAEGPATAWWGGAGPVVVVVVILAWLYVDPAPRGPAGKLPPLVAALALAWLAVLGFRWLWAAVMKGLTRSTGAASPRPAPGQGATGSGQGGAGGDDAVPPRGTARSAPERWRMWLARLAVTSRLSTLIGRRQAAYMRRMLEMFDEGDLREALRHAIPLGGDGEASAGPAFGTPGPRDDLRLDRPRGGGARTGIGVDDAFEVHLRQVYRRAFERLDRAGLIDEAVFVLAELLQSRQEALDYLERHQRFEQAAKLALQWDMDSATIVRLLCLSGDWRRAVVVARRDQSFAQAVLQLRKRWPEAAAQLTEAWARSLADEGRWLDAVRVLWPLDSHREQAAEWLARADAAGGELAAQALIVRALVAPDTMPSLAAPLRALLDDPARHRDRAALAGVLAVAEAKDRNAAVDQLARRVLPPLLADQADGVGRLPRPQVQRLIDIAQDPWLRADLPDGVPLPAPLLEPLAPRDDAPVWHAPEPGTLAVLDAAPAGAGRTLVAFGEAGAALLDEGGRVRTRFAVPASRLVTAPSGLVALALAPRGDVWRVSRIDVLERRVTDLGSLAFDRCATTFDGIGWTVVQGRALRVLDTREGLQQVLWQVTDLPGPVGSVVTDGQDEHVVLGDGRQGLEHWHYVGLQRRLAGREALALPEGDGRGLLHPRRGWWHLAIGPDRATLEGDRVAGTATTRRWSVPWDGGALDGWSITAGGDEWLMRRPDGRHELRSADAGGLLGVLQWPAAKACCARHAGHHWLVFDEAGRLWSVDTRSGAEWRVSVRE